MDTKTIKFVVGYYIDCNFRIYSEHHDRESAMISAKRLYNETHGVTDVEIRFKSDLRVFHTLSAILPKYEVDDELVSEFVAVKKSEMDCIEKSVSRPPTKEQMAAIDERHRKMCTGEWDGPETPYVKVIKEMYKNRDWAKVD